VKIRAHLCFDGTCEAAFRFYQETLGGQLVTMLRYGESPLADTTPASMRDKILHASLVLGSEELLGVDVAPDDHRPPAGYFVLLNVPELARARDVFAALSAGGSVRMPFQSTFWSPGFGVLVDRFGIPWEVNCESAAPAEPARDCP
jgi:PhnB protein